MTSYVGTTIAHTVPPYVEPGRLEARVSEYYRKLEAVLGIPSAVPGTYSDRRFTILVILNDT